MFSTLSLPAEWKGKKASLCVKSVEESQPTFRGVFYIENTTDYKQNLVSYILKYHYWKKIIQIQMFSLTKAAKTTAL